MKKNVLLIVGIVLVLIAGIAYILFNKETRLQSSDSNNSKGVVALVNGEEISQVDFDELYIQMTSGQGIDVSNLDPQTIEQLKNQTIDTIVSQTLLRQVAEASGLSATEEEIDLQLTNIKSQFSNDTEFEEALSSEGMNQDALRAQIASNLLIQSFIENELKLSDITATESEISVVYDEASAMQEIPPLEDIYEQVKQSVIQQKQQKLMEDYIKGLREDAEIKINI